MQEIPQPPGEIDFTPITTALNEEDLFNGFEQVHVRANSVENVGEMNTISFWACQKAWQRAGNLADEGAVNPWIQTHFYNLGITFAKNLGIDPTDPDYTHYFE